MSHLAHFFPSYRMTWREISQKNEETTKEKFLVEGKKIMSDRKWMWMRKKMKYIKSIFIKMSLTYNTKLI